MANIVVAAIAKWNGSALVKGEKQLSNFQKTTNKLAKSFVGLFAAQKIIAFGKASVQAFAADEKAARSLAVALKNTGNGFATIATESFIGRLQDTFKVLDDDLRPSFQTLLNATGSLTTSQKALELALNISAGTGKDLGSVSMALAKGFAGQTQGLSRLGAGLDKATLKTGDMDKITAALAAKFAGQALAATKTYTGQMAALTVATEAAKEEIGKGLLDSIALLAGNNGIDNATKSMEGFTKATTDALYGIVVLINELKNSPFGKVYGFTQRFSILGQAKALGERARPAAVKGAAYSPTSMYFTMETAERAKLVATLKKSNSTEKEKQKLSAAEIADKKKQAELEALKKKFDVDRINLQVALANSTDEAEKARIRSLLTIMDEDANAAAKRMAELDKANAAKLNSEYLLALSLNDLTQAAKYAAMGVRELTLGGAPISQYQTYKDDPMYQKAIEIESISALLDSEAALAGANAAMQGAGISAPTVNNFTINTPLGTEEALTEAMQRALQNLNRYGASTTFAGAIPLP